MKRWILAASLVLALSVAGIASAQTLSSQAQHLRREVIAHFGKRAPGRDILRWGILKHGKTRSATHNEVREYVNTLTRMLAPPPVVRVVTPTVIHSSTTSTTNTTSSTSPSTGSSLPACTWQPESGGNPRAVNPSSGAGGYYQIMPSTWTAHGGTGLPQDASMAEQTSVAQDIWRTQGASAWVNC